MERLRSTPLTREIPVHFVSGVDSPERRFALGAVGYLMKPATHAELALAARALTSAEGAARHILVVEDSAVEGESLCELPRAEGFEVGCVGSAREALKALEQSSYGCMILDLDLPDMDGLTVLETLRAGAAANAPRVIVHTGRALSKSETKQLEAYAEAVVPEEGNSAARLIEELRLLVSHVKDSLKGPARSNMSGRASAVHALGDMHVVFCRNVLIYAGRELRERASETFASCRGRPGFLCLGMNEAISAESELRFSAFAGPERIDRRRAG